MTTYQSSSSAGTKKFGRELAKKILKSGQGKKAIVVALSGELGAGKTTFTQGFAAGLGIKGRIQSPTFILMRNTKLPQLSNSKFVNFIHIDAYRADSKDFLKLGFKEITTDSKNIILVEWADRLKKIIPKSAMWLKLSHGKKENERLIIMNDELWTLKEKGQRKRK